MSNAVTILCHPPDIMYNNFTVFPTRALDGLQYLKIGYTVSPLLRLSLTDSALTCCVFILYIATRKQVDFQPNWTYRMK